MNTNPIICDPDSDEAKALIGQMCEFSDYYIHFKKDSMHTDILKCIENTDYPFVSRGGAHWIFIRKAEEKLSEKLRRWSIAHENYGLELSVIYEVIAKLRELGE